MNIQKVKKQPPIHKVVEVLKDKGVVVSACGHWFNQDDYKETSENITCRTCLVYLKGGLTSQERSSE